MHRHQPLEMRLDLLDHARRPGCDDRDSRDMRLVMRLRDGQALDIVATAREQAGDAREHAGLVVDDHREGVPIDRLDDGLGGIVGLVHLVRSCRAACLR